MLDSLINSYPELEKVLNLTIQHTMWRKKECINMIASENVMSPLAMLLPK